MFNFEKLEMELTMCCLLPIPGSGSKKKAWFKPTDYLFQWDQASILTEQHPSFRHIRLSAFWRALGQAGGSEESPEGGGQVHSLIGRQRHLELQVSPWLVSV